MDFMMHRRAQNAIGQGCLTNSKRPESHIMGVYPTHVVKGSGCQIMGTDGLWYVDFICGLGANLLGYGNEIIARAIHAGLRDGYSLSFSSVGEVETAEALKEIVPWADAFKFLKTGSEACSAAIRIARNATGRTMVLSEGYHGWHDGFVSLTPPANGIPSAGRLGFEKLGDHPLDDSVAAVIVEPVILDHGPERRAFLQALREKCTQVGAILIFDEVITGFRWPRFTFSTESGIHPDLICLGKAMGGGLPLSAVGGKKELMHDPGYFVSSTHAGELLSLAAARAVIKLLQRPNALEELWESGERFRAEANALMAPAGIRIDGYGTRGAFVGDPVRRALFFQECCLGGILFGPSWFWNVRHGEHQTLVMSAVNDIAQRVARGEVTLRGQMPQPAFAAKARGQS